MKNKKVMFVTQAAMIAAIYVVLGVAFAAFGTKAIQVRLAEALTILPIFTQAAIPGLFIGCLLSNVLAGAILPDVIFGSLATFLTDESKMVYRSKVIPNTWKNAD